MVVTTPWGGGATLVCLQKGSLGPGRRRPRRRPDSEIQPVAAAFGHVLPIAVWLLNPESLNQEELNPVERSLTEIVQWY